MRTASTYLIGMTVALTIAQPAFAWGRVGHAIVAEIATSRLTPQTSAEVSRLLALEGASRMSDVSSWADDIKQSHMPSPPDHSVRLPLGNGPVPGHPCPNGFCVCATSLALLTPGTEPADAVIHISTAVVLVTESDPKGTKYSNQAALAVPSSRA